MEGFPVGFEIKPVDAKKAEWLKLFKGHGDSGNVEVLPDVGVMASKYREYHQEIKDFEFIDTDVILMTYPKSGTTWLQEILWSMLLSPNLDHPMKDIPLAVRSPTLELDVTVGHIPPPQNFVNMFKAQFPDFDMSHGAMLHACKTTPNPRIIKTHYSFDIISPTALTKAKVVCVIRDPRDVCISFCHYCRLFNHEGFEGTLDDFVDIFLGSSTRHGSYWPNVSKAWSRKNHPNVHLMFYENLKRNTGEELKLLDNFLGTNLSEDQLKKIEHYTSFAEMKKRDDHVCPKDDVPQCLNMALAQKEGGFFKTGGGGGWKKVLNEEQKERFQVWIKENCPDPKIMEIIEGAQ